MYEMCWVDRPDKDHIKDAKLWKKPIHEDYSEALRDTIIEMV
jgi:hypothetical protein